MNIAKLVYILLFTLIAYIPLVGQNPCGCSDCPSALASGADTTLFYYINNIQNNNLNSNPLEKVSINFSTDEIGRLEFVLQAPSGQEIQIIGRNLTNKSTLFSSWDVSFVPCGEPTAPDPGINEVWSNESSWVGFENYEGTYYSVECLNNLNASTINGIWSLKIKNTFQGGSNRQLKITNFDLFFEDETGRDTCFDCATDPIDFEETTIRACRGDDALFIPATNSRSIDTFWIGLINDTITSVSDSIDLRDTIPAFYTYRLFVLPRDDTFSIADVAIGQPLVNLSDSIQKMRSCGQIADESLIFNITEPSITNLDTTLCQGDSLLLSNGSVIFDNGIYLDTIHQGCDSIVRYALSFAPSQLIERDSISCSVGTDTTLVFEYKNLAGCDSTVQITVIHQTVDTTFLEELVCQQSLNEPDTLVLQSITGCDSIVVYTRRLELDTFQRDSIVCGIGDDVQQDILVESGVAGVCDSIITFDILYKPSYEFVNTEYVCALPEVTRESEFLKTSFGCDSILTTQFEVYKPDTTFIEIETCTEEASIDTMAFATKGCDSVVIINTIFTKIDTIVQDSIVCGNNADSTYFKVSSDAVCADVMQTNILYFPTYFTSDTVFNCVNDSSIFETRLETAQGCDSIMQAVFVPKEQDTTFTISEVCDTLKAGLDTLSLTNQFGCDSLVIVENVFIRRSTLFKDSVVCGLSSDTLILDTVRTDDDCPQVIGTLIQYNPTFFIAKDSISCQAPFIDTLFLKTTFGCDSLIEVSYAQQIPDTIIQVNSICSGVVAAPDTAFFGCDSVRITIEEKEEVPVGARDSIVCTSVVRADSTFLETATTAFGCDSLTEVTLLFKPTYSFARDSITCLRQNGDRDTLIMQSAVGCDSLEIITYQLPKPDTVRSAQINCDTSVNYIDTVVLEAAGFCTTIQITEVTGAKQTPTLLTEIVCNNNTTPDTAVLANQFGCDSLVVTNYIFQEPYETERDSFVCGFGQDTIIERTFFNGLRGCDSTEFIHIQYLPPVSFADTFIVCEPADVRTDTSYLISEKGCDSLYIEHFELELGDTLINLIATCRQPLPIDTLNRPDGTFCPLVVINVFFDARDTTRVQNITCDNALPAFDTTFFNNQFGCDSMVITENIILPSYNLSIDSFVCEVDRPQEVLNLQTSEGCDSIITITFNSLASDTTFERAERCAVGFIPFDTLELENQFGCDSTVVIAFTRATKDTIIETVNVCAYPNGNERRTLFYGGDSGCDTMLITNYELIPDEVININQPTCDASLADVVNTIIVRNDDGCRTITNTIFRYTAPVEIVDTLVLCDQSKADSIVITPNQFGCDSIINRFVFEQVESSINFTFKNVCNASEVGIDTTVLVNQFGCDSVLIEERYYFEPQVFYDTVFTCDPDEVSRKRRDIQTIGGCDSLIFFTINTLLRSDFIYDTSYVCDLETTFLDTAYLQNTLGCDSTVVAVNMPDTSLQYALETTDVSCAGQADGQLEVEEILPVSIQWEDGSTELNRSDLSSGTYSIILRSEACQATEEIVIQEPDTLTLSVSSDFTSCVENSGVLQAIVTGGRRPYSYSWSNSGTGPIIQNLSAGDYTIEASDASGCFIRDTVTFEAITPTNVDVEVRNISCFGERDGRIFFEPLDMDATLRYQLNGVTLADTAFKNLLPGRYSVKIIDNNNCEIDKTIEIIEPEELEASVLIEPRLDNSFNLTVQVEGGTPPYNYLWNDGRKGPSNNLESDNDYAVRVGDINGCFVYLDQTMPTFTENIKSESLSLYPNPTTGDINVNFQEIGNLFPLKWVVLNIEGKQVLAGELNKAGIETINTNVLPQGVYIFKAMHPTVTFVNRFIKVF